MANNHSGNSLSFCPQPSPPPPDPDAEIEEKFLDPTSLEGRAIRLQSLTSSLSPLGRRITMELPESLLNAATSFEERLSTSGILTIEIRQHGELIGSCSTRVTDDDGSGDEDSDSNPRNLSPLHRASGVQVELHRRFTSSSSGLPPTANGRLGPGWADPVITASAFDIARGEREALR